MVVKLTQNLRLVYCYGFTQVTRKTKPLPTHERQGLFIFDQPPHPAAELNKGAEMTVQKKTSKDKLVKEIVDVMLSKRGFASDGYLPWAKQILVVMDPGGKRQPYLADEKQILSPISVEGVAAEILRYVDLHDDTTLLIDHDLAVKIAKTYLLRATPIDPPEMVRDVDEPGYCLHRHPYKLLDAINADAVEGACPLFWDWTQRIVVNREAVICWIGSLFVPDSYNQQYCILKGRGMDGKGALLNCLADFFGPLYASTFGEKVKGERWTTSTHNKRLVAFPDAQKLEFLNSEVFKAITGGNPVPFRFLYQEEFSAPTAAKFLICTNEDVDVTGMFSDRRRRVYAEMVSAGSATPDYMEQLKEEAQIFFSWCQSEYLAKCNKGLPILIDDSVEDEMEDEAKDEFRAFVDRYCNVGWSKEVQQADLYRWFRQHHDTSKKSWRRFKNFLTDDLNASMVRVNNQRKWKGIEMKGHLVPIGITENRWQ